MAFTQFSKRLMCESMVVMPKRVLTEELSAIEAQSFIKRFIVGRDRSAATSPRPWSGDIHLDGFLLAARELRLVFEPLGEGSCRIVDGGGGRVIGELRDMISNLVGIEAIGLCCRKDYTLKALRGICPVPEQAVFTLRQGGAAEEYAMERSFGVVVKPVSLAGGRGITTRIRSAEDFRNGWRKAVAAIMEKCSAPYIVVEEYLPGVDLRVIVVRDRVACATTRVPAHVIGTGRATVADLIAEKNWERAKHPHHRLYPLPPNPEIDGCDPTVWIPERGEVVLLSQAANVHCGGEAFDVTDMLPDHVCQDAVRAVQAIPGLNVAGVDFQASGFGTKDRATIIELNTYANFGIHYYPYFGQPRNPARAVIDAMLATPIERSSI
ncbi:MAG: hypothetical protein WBN89_15980 [Prochlorococcaceae cyanobacterium]